MLRTPGRVTRTVACRATPRITQEQIREAIREAERAGESGFHWVQREASAPLWERREASAPLWERRKASAPLWDIVHELTEHSYLLEERERVDALEAYCEEDEDQPECRQFDL